MSKGLFCSCLHRRRKVLASRPFDEKEFAKSDDNCDHDASSLVGPGIEGFLSNMERPPSSLSHCLIDTLEKYHGQSLQVDADTGKALTYNDVRSEALALVNGLRSRGVKSGDSIGLLASSRDPKVNVILVATIILGAVFEPIDPNDIILEDHLRKLAKKGLRIWFCVDEKARDITAASKEASGESIIILLGSKTNKNKHDVQDVQFFTDVLEERDIEEARTLEPHDQLVIIHGQPDSGDVILKNEDLLKHSTPRRQISDEMGRGLLLDYEDWSTGGEAWIIRRLFLLRSGGCTLVNVTPFDPENTLALIQTHRVSWLSLQRSQLSSLEICPAIVGYDLGSLQLLSSPGGGSFLQPENGEDLNSIRERMPATRIVLTGKTVADAIPK